MNTPGELPENVVAEIRAGRKIEAIKLLREQCSMDLRDAKDAVDAYIAGLPASPGDRLPRNDMGTGRLVFAALVVVAVYMAYRIFA
ncbi:MAG: hypothetical protein R3E50_06310 [Halioglobus sp.]